MIPFAPEFSPEIRVNRERLAKIISIAIMRAEAAHVDEPLPSNGDTSKYALLLFGTEEIHEIDVVAGPLIWGAIDLELSSIRIDTRIGPAQQDAARILATRGGFPQAYTHQSVIRPVRHGDDVKDIALGTVARWDTAYDLTTPEGRVDSVNVAAMTDRQMKSLDLQVASSSPFKRSYLTSMTQLVGRWREEFQSGSQA